MLVSVLKGVTQCPTYVKNMTTGILCENFLFAFCTDVL